MADLQTCLILSVEKFQKSSFQYYQKGHILNRCSEKSRQSVDVSLDELYIYFKEMNEVENDDIKIVINLNENNHDMGVITPTDQLTGTTPLSKIKLNNLKYIGIIKYTLCFKYSLVTLSTPLDRVDNRLMCLWTNFISTSKK
jgi:hypothetical protein